MGINLIHLTQHRQKWLPVVNVAMNLRVPYNPRDFFTSCETTGLRIAFFLGYNAASMGNQIPTFQCNLFTLPGLSKSKCMS